MNTTYIKVCLYLVLLSLPFSSVHSVYLKLSEQNFIPTSTTAGKKIEYYAVWSSKEGPWPVVLYIHGHQHPERMGGKKYLKDKTLGEMAKNGYLAIAISMPGYGNSSGPPDFCGPSTQNAVIALIKYLRTQPFVIPEKIVLIGESRGALVGSMVAT